MRGWRCGVTLAFSRKRWKEVAKRCDRGCLSAATLCSPGRVSFSGAFREASALVPASECECCLIVFHLFEYTVVELRRADHHAGSLAEHANRLALL